MANYSTLKAAVTNVVKTNGAQEITGANLQTVLLSIIDSVGGGGYIFKGVATPSTIAGTPDENVFYIGGAGTYANFGTSVVVPPTNIAVFKYSGTWACEQVTVENGGVFDISAFKAVGGTLATYADIATALGTNGANIPVGVRKGGMSIKFVQSSDNKYVQYRYMESDATTDATFTNTANWQGVDDESVAGSKNLVESGGIAYDLAKIIKPTSINLFDKTKVTDGYILDGGTISPHTKYKTSDYILVTPGVGYRCYNNYNFMVCLYDKFGGFVKYYTRSNDFNNTSEQQIPDNAVYARFTMRNEDVDTAIFANSVEYYNRNAWESTTAYEEGIVADKLKGEVIEQSKSVATMQGLITWLGNVIDTDKYHYTIYLEEGTYSLTPAIIDSIQTEEYGRIGILLPNNVDLIGLGSGAKIVCDLTGVETGYQQYISPLNIKWNNRLKNLTIEITNGRYAVHADNSNDVHDVKWEIENCTFIHHGNSDGTWDYPYAWGEGGCSGHHAIFMNCKFISPSGAYYAHNNVGFEKPMYHRFDSCVFLSTSNAVAVSLQSLNSGTKDVMEFNGCTFNGILDSRKGSAASADFNSCDFVVIGGGNSPLCENWYYTDGIPYHSCFGDEVIPFINNTDSQITAGSFMRWNGDVLIPMTAQDSTITFVGVCLDNVPIGGEGFVKVKGTIRVIQPASVVWATLGTKLKVASNTEFAIADNINVIGKMYYRNAAFTRYYMLLE